MVQRFESDITDGITVVIGINKPGGTVMIVILARTVDTGCILGITYVEGYVTVTVTVTVTVIKRPPGCDTE